ncbi:MAG: GTPase HflX [candidate division Zixibacteria bacterium]|nr:GTPase HflX [candidate division Zixibacteria bacterium]
MTQIEFEKKNYQAALLGAVILNAASPLHNNSHLGELRALAETAGAEIVGEVIQNRNRPDPAFYFGKGKVSEVKQIASENKADLFIFDDDLSPAQVRNLEEQIGIPVVDRSGLILDIFALHARTTESRTQVKLAQLKYLLPRLAGRWRHLERQEGAIGTRGPGETQLETDRRLITKQISELEKKLENIGKERDTQRKKRKSLFKIALVGYTNAGKSTVLNRLTNSKVLVENKLFATLDSTTRRLELDYGEAALLTDTVGFIAKLPAHLVASFRSTLKDVSEADLLLHVIDIADEDFEHKVTAVNEELKRLGSLDKNRILVFNKLDSYSNDVLLEVYRKRYPEASFISAMNNIGVDVLVEKIKAEFRKGLSELLIYLDKKHQELYPEISKSCHIIDSTVEGDDIVLRVIAHKEKISKLLTNNQKLKTTTIIS